MNQYSKRPRKVDSTRRQTHTMTAEERHENDARMRRTIQSRPARYVNGVRLSADEEVANIT